MATFGYSGTGATADGGGDSNSLTFSSPFPAETGYTGLTGTGASMSCYASNGDGSSSHNISMALYTMSGTLTSTCTFTLVAQTAVINVPISQSKTLYTSNFLVPPTLSSGTNYFLFVNADDSHINFYYDSGQTGYDTFYSSGISVPFSTIVSTGWWSTLSSSSNIYENLTNYQYVIYVTMSSGTPLGITTNAATNVLYTTVQLNGYVNIGDASSATVTFDYGLTNAYGTTVTATQSPVAASQAVSANVAALSASTLYHFRAKAIG